MCRIGGGNARVENVGPEEHALAGARAQREAEEPLKQRHHFICHQNQRVSRIFAAVERRMPV